MNKIQPVAFPTVSRQIRRSAAAQVCRVPKLDHAPDLDPAWGVDNAWSVLPNLEISQFHDRSGTIRPKTSVRLAHTGDTLFVSFSVADDRSVRISHTKFQSNVSDDSCVEFFAQPAPDGPYFNFEVNAGGALLLYHIADPTPGDGVRLFKSYEPVPWKVARQIRIATTLPKSAAEIRGPIKWRVVLTIPLQVFSEYFPDVRSFTGQHWRGNFFKCLSKTSAAHWASWRKIGSVLRFHQPKYFGPIEFE